MNNSLARLIDGMAETLRREVIPNVGDEFARGQAFGVIYMLNCIKLRASWSPVLLHEQIDALDDLSRALDRIDRMPKAAPRPRHGATRPTDPEALEAMRDEGDAAVGRLIDWLHANRPVLAPNTLAATRQAIDGYIHDQLRRELRTSARPMFAEISSGEE